MMSITDRPLVYRKHPRQTRFPKSKYFKISCQSLENDLKKAWCVVTLTSNIAVDAILRGVPVIALHKYCMAYSVSGHHLEQVNYPYYSDTKQWLYDLSYSEWNFNELSSGEAWSCLSDRLTNQQYNENTWY